MTRAQRQSAANGIWLCGRCAGLIDRDILGHPIELLVGWRTDAEIWARARLGKRPPQESDATKLLSDVLISGGRSVDLSPSVIKNAHDAANRSLEHLDSRFKITSTFDGEGTRFRLDALEPVDIKFNVPIAIAADWQQKLKALRDHGEEATLPLDAVVVNGSPLIKNVFEEGVRDGAKLLVNPVAHAASLKLISDIGSDSRTIARAKGELRLGLSSFNFSAKLVDGLAKFGIKKGILAGSSASDGSFTFGVNYDRWDGQLVQDLAEFEEIYELIDNLMSAEIVRAELSVSGRRLLGAVIKSPGAGFSFVALQSLLKYTLAAREISAALGIPIPLRLNVQICADDALAVTEAASIAMGRKVFHAKDLAGDPTCTVDIVDDEAFNELMNRSESVVIRYLESEQKPINLYGQLIILPQQEVLLESVRPRVVSEKKKRGVRSVKFAWVRQEGFKCTIRYLK